MSSSLACRPLWWFTVSLLMAGCASDKNNLSPSLLSELKGKGFTGQQVSYQTETEEELGTRKIKDPLALKLQYAKVMEQFEHYPDARMHYNAVLGEQPENFEAVIGLARVEQAVGETEAAEAGFRKALALRPDSAAALHALGQFQLSQGRTGDALPLLNKAVLAQPNEKAYRFDLAVALAQSGDVNAALPHFKRTVGEAAAHHNIGTVLREKGDVRGAEQHFRQALSIQPDLSDARQALVSASIVRGMSRGRRENQNGSVVQGRPIRASCRPPTTPTPHLVRRPSPYPRLTSVRIRSRSFADE
ncbi:MAG: tetratricopeptide repeat protein [Planctomycetaceae bacterium]|nr:tetratricopeptide repeat protein [Planctomycetaceae bacterium]